ncbi:cytochrome d ubiquinol oxidase subunit II [Aliirhizobium cellulosilyticum]|uniref:Cytochrome d ubiquinol oxidase subunit II n=1 Tax=Aliirhizobium cellulosilyticum TaxID=393664 RepID=A0A7W6V0V0_9HYPH|nr:cytochrome d ubiquinol oxidase subunit II [Rhizobium cellulosilyticum]MBB4349349.1 cytochrome d ubiquinol oxidase subunit II [Rhizobium cellulosilyticum]MBB4412429.1 cytochrome d ubiquinol oxidase subunit II [Rhizobium cellulosilyticum]MBB4447061.1 cytochrome d ubiquinol oxidase subunit II [Rhizobium cellulosilyticum]
MGIDLPLIWAVIIAFGVMMYVIMDGFDLGIGILFPFIKDRQERDAMVNTVAPVWDGNETWLVLGGAALFAAFPLAYGLLLSALYLPLMFMLAGLIWRGVSFEFRFKASDRHKPFWDKAFACGSYVATFSQGVALGAFINGFELDGTTFTGTALDCFTPFSIFTGFALLFAYALLGSTWLIMKTAEDLQRRMRYLAQWISIALFFIIVAVSVWTPIMHSQVAERWFKWPNIFWFAPVPLLVVATTWLQVRILQKREPHATPFVLSLVLIFLGYSGLAISMWPYVIPPTITIWAAAAPPESMGFALVGTLLIIPVILVYTAWSYYVFRGKQAVGEGYH